MSKTKLLHHIVFATKHRLPSLTKEGRRELFAYIYGIISNHKCFLIRINGVEDHIHILVNLHPTVAVAKLVKEIKQSSSLWIKQTGLFTNFSGWNEGYYAVTLSPEHQEVCRNYIIRQEIHHHGKNLIDEVMEMSGKYGLEWFPGDWD